GRALRDSPWLPCGVLSGDQRARPARKRRGEEQYAGLQVDRSLAGALPMNPLYGLVLSGGLSTRMGRDKGSLVYSEGRDQRTRGLELLRPFCDKVYVSIRREQEEFLPAGMPRIFDELSDVG